MANITEIRRAVTAAIGALIISSACVAAAVGPAAAPTQPAYAGAQVQSSAQANA